MRVTELKLDAVSSGAEMDSLTSRCGCVCVCVFVCVCMYVCVCVSVVKVLSYTCITGCWLGESGA